MKIKNKGKKFALFLFCMAMPLVVCRKTVFAIEDKDVIKILSQNSELFQENGFINGAFRFIGWGITKGLAAVADVCSSLYDTCFRFIDFTNYKPIKTFINDWKDVFIALVCLSLLLIGILLCIGWEKKPKIAINLLIAVTVVSSSTYVINTLNKFISTEVRSEILGEDENNSVVYQMVGNNVHDLKWLNSTVGLSNLNKKKNAKKTYSTFSKSQFKNLDIQEILDPDDFEGDAEYILTYGLSSESDEDEETTYSLDELSDGVAWTDLLNEFYYRYTVDYGVLWMELASLIIIYLFMSYKVIRIIYDIVVHRLLAYLYSANLNNNQKILKILDSLKDSYIMLLMTTVMIKFYLLATKYVSGWEITGIAKGIILLFIAFAVVDGPNLVQKLTGSDLGASDGMGKMMSLFYGGKLAAGVVGAGAGLVKGGVGAGKTVAGKVSSRFSKNKDIGADIGANEQMLGAAGEAAAADNIVNADNGQENHHSSDRKEQNNLNQNNVENAQADIRNDSQNPGEGAGASAETLSGGKTDSSMAEGVSENGVSENGRNGAGESSSSHFHEKGSQGNKAMDSIGRVPSRADALNGNTAGSSYRTATNSMKQMEKDLQGERSFEAGSSPSGGQPIEAGGKMFEKASMPSSSSSVPGEKTRKAKDVFDGKREGGI